MLCFAPLIAVGALIHSIETSWHTQESLVGPYVQVQTCSQGLGGYMKGSHEWIAGGVQYAMHVELGRGFVVSVPLQGGGSYSNTIHPTSRVRQITRFHAGVGVVLHYQQYYVLVEYNHLSNGKGSDPTNVGQDHIGVQVGYQFN